MGALTETEIFDCLSDSFRKAAHVCEDLARLPKKGPNYRHLRSYLKLIEGSARQAAYWRQDARWLRIGLYVAEAHKRAGAWLRGWKASDGTRVLHRPGTLHPLFMKLAENLRAGHARAEEFRTKRTDRIGTILPKPLRPPHRETVPVGWRKSAGGILLPSDHLAGSVH